jgi:hypothetical protein
VLNLNDEEIFDHPRIDEFDKKVIRLINDCFDSLLNKGELDSKQLKNVEKYLHIVNTEFITPNRIRNEFAWYSYFLTYLTRNNPYDKKKIFEWWIRIKKSGLLTMYVL